MCQSIAEGGRRCKGLRASMEGFAERIATEVVSAGSVAEAVNGVDMAAAKAALGAALRDGASKHEAELDEYRRSRVRRRGHFPCDLAASIGEACATLSGITGSVADAIAQAVAPNNAIAAGVVKAVVNQWLKAVASSTPLEQLKMLGHMADAVAVDVCPRPASHTAVRDAERRLGSAALEACT